jgi:phage terminase large subunit GpA-like protein
VLYGDPSTPDLWRDLDELLMRKYRHSRDLHDLCVLAACVDSGGHYTDQVINYCFERRRNCIWAIKGDGAAGRPIWPANPSVSKKMNKPVYIVGVNDAKTTIMGRLRRTEGDGLWHFPLERENDWFAQLTNEIETPCQAMGRRIHEWRPRKAGLRTEALDCRVYAYAALRGLKRGRNYNLDLDAEKVASVPFRETAAPVQTETPAPKP